MGDGYKKMKSELMRIFGEKREKEELGWMGGCEKKREIRLDYEKAVLCVVRMDTKPVTAKRRRKNELRCFHCQKTGHMVWERPVKIAEGKCWKC